MEGDEALREMDMYGERGEDGGVDLPHIFHTGVILQCGCDIISTIH